MKAEYLEPYKKLYPTRTDLLNEWSEWFESKKDEWILFTLTVVFKTDRKLPRNYDWGSEYKHRVLQKIRRSIESNEKNQSTAIPFEDFWYYEKNESTLFIKSKSKNPHHIHALIPIRTSQVHRFWSSDLDAIQPSLMRDFYSIDTLQSILIEKVRSEETTSWVNYIAKMKPI